MQYSNLGFYLLGKIIEKVTKKSFIQYFGQNKFFAGLTNTDFNPPASEFLNIAPCEFDTCILLFKIRNQKKNRQRIGP